MTNNIHEYIKNQIESHYVVLFMKGTVAAPMCGFSGMVVRWLNKLGVAFHAVDVLASSELREGIKSFTDWPTIPQLYIKGEFIGGCDIVREMNESGELVELLKAKGIKFSDVSQQ